MSSYLSHIWFKLFKNSLHAIVERYEHEKEDTIPPIKVIVIEGKEDNTIKISDEGSRISIWNSHAERLGFGRKSGGYGVEKTK